MTFCTYHTTDKYESFAYNLNLMKVEEIVNQWLTLKILTFANTSFMEHADSIILFVKITESRKMMYIGFVYLHFAIV